MGKLARAQNPLSLRYRGRSRKEENTSQPHTRYVATIIPSGGHHQPAYSHLVTSQLPLLDVAALAQLTRTPATGRGTIVTSTRRGYHMPIARLVCSPAIHNTSTSTRAHNRNVARSGRTLSPAPANQVLVLGKMLPAACTKNLHSLTSPPVCYQPLGGLYDFHTPGTRAARIVSFSLSNRNPFAGSVSFRPVTMS